MAESNFELAEAEHVENRWKTMIDVWLKTADKVFGCKEGSPKYCDI